MKIPLSIPRAGALWLLVLSACGGTTPVRAPEPALVAVELLRQVPLPAPSPPRVALLVDASASMRSPAAAGVSRLAAAQTRASEVLATLPPETRVSIDAIGLEASERCGPPSRVAPAGSAGGDEAATESLRGISGGGEGSLAAGLQGVTRDLVAEGSADGARVVAFSDLDDGCGGDLCAAVGALVAAGASLDLVLLADRPTPPCVTTASAGSSAPDSLRRIADPLAFQVMPASGGVVDGSTGGRPVTAPAGPARIVVALEPPLEIGPITLTPDALVRVRVLDFPAARPPVREWSLEVLRSRGEVAVTPASSPPQRP